MNYIAKHIQSQREYIITEEEKNLYENHPAIKGKYYFKETKQQPVSTEKIKEPKEAKKVETDSKTIKLNDVEEIKEPKEAKKVETEATPKKRTRKAK